MQVNKHNLSSSHEYINNQDFCVGAQLSHKYLIPTIPPLVRMVGVNINRTDIETTLRITLHRGNVKQERMYSLTRQKHQYT